MSRFLFILICYSFISSLTLLSLARSASFCHLKEGRCNGNRHTFTKRNDKNPFFNLTLPDYSTAAFADLDNDGDLDMQVLTGNGTIIKLVQYENIGNKTSPTFSNNHFNILFETNEMFDLINTKYPTFALKCSIQTDPGPMIRVCRP